MNSQVSEETLTALGLDVEVVWRSAHNNHVFISGS